MKRLRENLVLKLVSVVLAIVIWLIVMNISKPEVQSSQTVPLEVLHQDAFLEEKKTWEIDRSSVVVSFSVRADQLQGISANDFHAYVDLEDYSITGSVPIYVEALNDKANLVGNLTTRPSVARIRIEDIQEKTFSIAVHEKGFALEGYSIASIAVEPETVLVTGPETEVGRISEVGIEIDVSGLGESRSDTAVPLFYDANGNQINDLQNITLSAEEIGYSIVVYKRKSVNILSSVTGRPAAGYQYEGTSLSPDSIFLSGPIAVIDQMTVLTLPEVDITDAEDNVTATFNINPFLPEGVTLAGSNPEVIVTVRIERIPEIVRPTTESSSETEAEETTESSSPTPVETTESREEVVTESWTQPEETVESPTEESTEAVETAAETLPEETAEYAEGESEAETAETTETESVEAEFPHSQITSAESEEGREVYEEVQDTETEAEGETEG